MSDHEAIVLCINTACKLVQNKAEHKSPLYHKANIVNIKSDLMEFQNTFLTSDPLSRSVEQNWLQLQAAISEAVSKYVPHKIIQSCNHLPWINKQIKKDMKTRKHLYNKAKKTNSNTD